MAVPGQYDIPSADKFLGKDEVHPLYASTGGQVPEEEDTPASNRYMSRRDAVQQQGGQDHTAHHFDFDGVVDEQHVHPYGKRACCSESGKLQPLQGLAAASGNSDNVFSRAAQSWLCCVFCFRCHAVLV